MIFSRKTNIHKSWLRFSCHSFQIFKTPQWFEFELESANLQNISDTLTAASSYSFVISHSKWFIWLMLDVMWRIWCWKSQQNEGPCNVVPPKDSLVLQSEETAWFPLVPCDKKDSNLSDLEVIQKPLKLLVLNIKMFTWWMKQTFRIRACNKMNHFESPEKRCICDLEATFYQKQLRLWSTRSHFLFPFSKWETWWDQTSV